VETVCWANGGLRPLSEARVGADDSAYNEGRGCFTTARATRGVVRFEARHVRRLVRDAQLLGFGPLDPHEVRRALAELAKAAFADTDGVVRLQASRDTAGAVHLLGVTRPLGSDPPQWRAIRAPEPHDGGVLPGGPKLSNRLALALAAEAAQRVGVQEALLFDRAERLVEGAYTNLIVVTQAGDLVTPPLERGAVAGIAREIALERVAELRERDVAAAELDDAREIVAVNAVRGARPITQLDARPVGDAKGVVCARLARALEED
jgi:branched-chain amino acid aminotransferase